MTERKPNWELEMLKMEPEKFSEDIRHIPIEDVLRLLGFANGYIREKEMPK